MKSTVPWGLSPCNPIEFHDVSEEHAVFSTGTSVNYRNYKALRPLCKAASLCKVFSAS